MNIIPPSRATTASRPTAIICAGLSALVTLAARSLRALTSRAMSDLHPHDLLVRLDRLVADGGGEFHGQVGLGRGGHEVVDVLELAGGDLGAELVGGVGQLLDLLEAGGEVDLAGAGGALRGGGGSDRRERRNAGADGGDAHECLPISSALVYASRAALITDRFSW